MKNKLIVFALIFISKVAIAQNNFQGFAIYKFNERSTKLSVKNNPNVSAETLKKIEDHMNEKSEKKFTLTFNSFESLYSDEEKNAKKNKFELITRCGNEGDLYKNIKENRFLVENEFMGDTILIQDLLPIWNWELLNETKIIEGYKCFKAKAIVKDNILKENNCKQSIINDSVLTKETELFCWYTSEIPISQGPAKFYGLPGLILEVNYDDTNILCLKVIPNSKEKFDIKIPKKGTLVSQKEFEAIKIDRIPQN